MVINSYNASSYGIGYLTKPTKQINKTILLSSPFFSRGLVFILSRDKTVRYEFLHTLGDCKSFRN